MYKKFIDVNNGDFIVERSGEDGSLCYIKVLEKKVLYNKETVTMDIVMKLSNDKSLKIDNKNLLLPLFVDTDKKKIYSTDSNILSTIIKNNIKENFDPSVSVNKIIKNRDLIDKLLTHNKKALIELKKGDVLGRIDIKTFDFDAIYIKDTIPSDDGQELLILSDDGEEIHLTSNLKDNKLYCADVEEMRTLYFIITSHILFLLSNIETEPFYNLTKQLYKN